MPTMRDTMPSVTAPRRAPARAVPVRADEIEVLDRDARILTRDDPSLDRARSIVNALDKYYLDPIIGFFVPGLGDIVTTAVGAYLVTIAARRGVPAITIARMLMNLGVDTAVGVVPFVGDIADVGIKANKKNLALLEERLAAPAEARRRASWRDWLAVGGALALVLGMLALAIYLLVRVFGAIF